MSTQDLISEMLNAMDRNPEQAETLRARILGDDFMADMAEVRNDQAGIADVLEKSAELTITMIGVITAIRTRQSGSDNAIAGLQQEQESVQSALVNIRTDMESMAANQSRMEAAIEQLQTDVATLKTDVATLKTDVAMLKTDVAMLKSDVSTLKSDVSILKSDMVYVKGRLDNTSGANYEFKVQKNLGSIAGQHLSLRRTRTLKGPRTDDDQNLWEQAYDAEDRGLITEAENHDMWLLDLIFSGQRRDDRAEVLVAAEISITAGDSDISRAKERAETLGKVTDKETMPIVIAASVDEERSQAARQAGVVIITVPEA